MELFQKLVSPVGRYGWILVVVALVGSACTSSSDPDAGSTTTDDESTVVTIDAMADVVDICRAELLKPEPDVVRLAIDPGITGFALNLTPDAVPETADGLYQCLGDDLGADYLVADTIVAGQQLPADLADCFQPHMESDGASLLLVSLRRARLEVPEKDEGDLFVDVLTDCVPGRFIAAPIRTQNEAAYVVAVDGPCLDAAHDADETAMRAFWDIQIFADGTPDPSVWSDEEAGTYVKPLYECIDTGAFIAADPTIGAALSAPTRTCIGGVAQDAGYWESRVALREFDQEAYEEAVEGCLTPEEAQRVLGTPIPTDDPIESNFAAVDDCFTQDTDDADTDQEDPLGEALQAAADGEDPEATIVTLAATLASCAGPEGVAGSYTGVDFGSPVPEGTYDCLLPLAEANPSAMLEGQLLIEAGLAPTPAGGDAFVTAFSRCIPPGFYALPLFADFSSPSISDTIDRACITEVLADGTEANEAYWAAFLGRVDGDGEPTDQARLAVAGLYDCVDPGGGFSSVARQAGIDISDTSVECIDTSVEELEPLERILVGAGLADGQLSQAIADCLSEEEVEALRGG